MNSHGMCTEQIKKTYILIVLHSALYASLRTLAVIPTTKKKKKKTILTK